MDFDWQKIEKITPNNQSVTTEKLQESISEFLELTTRLATLQNLVNTAFKNKSLAIPLELEVVPGSDLESLSTTILKDEEGSHIAAFFDLDRTLINDFSAKQFIQTRC